MRHSAAAVAALALLFAAACSAGAPSGASTSGDAGLLVTSVSGMKLSLDVDLDAQTAARATSAQPTPTAQELSQTSYQDGHSRTWTKGAEYLEVIVFHFATAEGATGFVQFENSAVTSAGGTLAFKDPSIPGSSAYTLYGNTRTGARQVFCQGIWFPLNEYAFNVVDCSSAIRYFYYVQQVAEQQFRLAAGALGVPIPSPVPTPTPT